MSTEGRRALVPIEVELFEVCLNKADDLRVQLRASGGGTIIIDFTTESPSRMSGFAPSVDKGS